MSRVHLAIGDDVSKLNFDQAHHRTYFPGYAIEVYCSCRMPETYDDMVECDTCGDWYHLKCVRLKSIPEEDEEWNCIKCKVR